jgi:hypothetical protein
MTDAERLKVAEEILREFSKRKMLSFRLTDVNAYLTEGGSWLAFENMDNPSGLVRGVADNPIDAIILARQKLAAEREAAMTPEVRKLKIALTAITRINEKSCDYFGCFRDAVTIARKALEES